jgi:hypothetical protein
MKLERRLRLAVVSALFVLTSVVLGCAQEPAPAPEEPQVAAAADPCAFPTAPAATIEETAWQLFVASVCPSSAGEPLAFENWTEQDCLDPAACGPTASRSPDASELARGLTGSGLPSSECSPMTTSSTSVSSLVPFVPHNLAASPTFCEEVFANTAEVDYIRQPAAGQSLLTLTAQAAYVTSGAKIDFPTDAIEIKADWVPVTSLDPPGFGCTSPSNEIYTETIGGVCYALAGMHISSKLFPNWLWATFEPQYPATNPNRCNPELYNSCSDAWGSDPPSSSGENTAITPALAALMDGANLAQAFSNYRLTGAQTDFVDTDTTPLGNSFVEFNAQVPAQQASCITCHSYAQFDSSQTPPVENPNFGAFPGTPPVGQPVTSQPPVPPGTWQSQDFSWMLGIQPQQ